MIPSHKECRHRLMPPLELRDYSTVVRSSSHCLSPGICTMYPRCLVGSSAGCFRRSYPEQSALSYEHTYQLLAYGLDVTCRESSSSRRHHVTISFSIGVPQSSIDDNWENAVTAGQHGCTRRPRSHSAARFNRSIGRIQYIIRKVLLDHTKR